MLTSGLAVTAGSTSTEQTFWQSVGDWMTKNAIIIVLTVVVSCVIWWLVVRLIRRVTNQAKNRLDLQDRPGQARGVEGTQELTAVLMSARREQRFEAIAQLLRSITTFTIATLAILIILGQLGVNMAPLLASAGVIGVALGFGAQTLVKDFLSGIFLVLEDQFGVGDVVDLGPATGTVEEVTLRVTRIRDLSGVVWYVRNGEILRVANRSQGWTMAIVDVPIAYNEDLDRVRRIVEEVGVRMDADPAYDGILFGTPTYAGVESVSGDAVFVRVTAKAAPDQQMSAGRALREQLKLAFDKAGVRVPVLVRQTLPPANPAAGGGTPTPPRI
jgi:small conductance mechanosensitive channel